MLLDMTGAVWRCAFVAAVFAIHPLRVESVAWVAELKDVLSGLFFMLTLWAYARYARRPESKARYAMVALWFALGLLSKPMLVTVPFVLLLLDYWPLGRLRQKSQLPRLLKEKLPLLALSAASCVATVIAQKKAIQPIDRVPLALRAGNALVAYVVYLGKLIYPSRLAVLYPLLKDGWPAWQVIAAALLLVALTAGAYILRRRQPFLVVGWLWYAGMLAPVIGILQVGHQAYADRYTYLPQIGLCLAGTWSVVNWTRECRYRKAVLGSAACAVLCALVVASYHQTTYWSDSETLWTHTLASTKDNDIAHNNLANVLLLQGRKDEAVAQYNEALRINPAYTAARNNLGNLLFQTGLEKEAMAQYREALRIDPSDSLTHKNLGIALFKQGHAGEATAQFLQALQSNPANESAHICLGNVLLSQGRPDDAVAQYREAVRIDPADALAHANLCNVLFNFGRAEEAIADARKALALEPADSTMQNSLAWMLATAPQEPLRDGAMAVRLATQASQSTGGNEPRMLRTLAAADAEAGDFSDAVQTAQNALQLAEAESNTNLVNELSGEIKLYEAGRPYHGGQ
jgi:tetratricopeptide (TPR) repeat protein